MYKDAHYLKREIPNLPVKDSVFGSENNLLYKWLHIFNHENNDPTGNKAYGSFDRRSLFLDVLVVSKVLCPSICYISYFSVLQALLGALDL